ncbi:hypothetical protein ACFIQG_18350 [Comamonas odontotermitis]|uniref:hypothetical protein n=1 Tax=Comamonas odontotermitis TaxID=379895 RepID=UPI0036703865
MSCPIAWYVVPALAALARNVRSTNVSINAAQLSAWTEDDHIAFPPGTAEMALSALQRMGWCAITSGRCRAKTAVNDYQVTAQGMHAAQAALRCMPDGPTPDVHELATRVWNLLRIRRRLTAEEAAETLVDADGEFAAKKKRIGALLAAWAKFAPKAVAVAQKREAGHIRYVLVNDLGRWPPPARAGQMHPVTFANLQAIPERFRKSLARTAEQGDGQ